VDRPKVLHVVRHWLAPSEGFVADVLRSTTATDARLVYGSRIDHPLTEAFHGPAHHLAAPWDSRQARARLAFWALTDRVQVLHSHFGQPAQLTWRTARRLGLPFGVSLHGYDLLVEARLDPSMLDAVKAANLVVVPSQFLADGASDRGIPDEILRVIPSGIDLGSLPFRTRPAPAAGEPTTVTFAGRFAPKKGVLDAARALGEAAQTRNLRVRFVGFGEQEAALRELVASVPSLAGAEVWDGREPGVVRRALRETDVLFTPSRTASNGDAETLGILNLEAQAMGVPVVTTSHGGIPEAVSGAGSVLAPEGDQAALSKALALVLDTPERWAEMGRAGRAHVAAHFELGSRVADLEEQWLSLASRRKAAAAPPPVRAEVPRVSVVMVTYNRRELLATALDALDAQTLAPHEVLVVDNGSTDGSAELLAARTSPAGLRVLPGAAAGSVAQARNVAVSQATGDVIAFTDDDCRPQPTWLEALAAGLREGVDLVQGRTQPDPRQVMHPLARSQDTPAEFGLYETCNIAYTRTALQQGGPDGPFDLDFADEIAAGLGRWFARYPFGEDTELAWRCKRAGVRSRFSAHAVVDHHVFAPDNRLLLRRAWIAAGFPMLAARVPELGAEVLWHRNVLSRHRPRILAAVAGVAVSMASRDVRPLVAAAPYLWQLLRPTQQGGRRQRLAAAPVLVARDVIETAALGYGSARARRLVL
jgi:colanic acid/amylovoran biosynthesis glycosyltransferase